MAIDGYDDGKTDDSFSGGHGHDEKDHHLAVGRAQIARKRDKSQVDGVEHEFDGHEHDDQIAPDQHADDADGKDHRA